MNVFTLFLVNPFAAFLTKCALLDQSLQPLRNCVIAVPRILRQSIPHGLHDMRQYIQPDQISGTKSGTFGPSNQSTG